MMDETWIHHYTPELREGLKQWVKPGKNARKSFCDTHSVIFIDYLEKGKTITGAYYAALLDPLIGGIRKKRPNLEK